MRVYLKSGKVVQVSKEDGVSLIETMMGEGGSSSISLNKVFTMLKDGKPYLFFQLNEIAAVK